MAPMTPGPWRPRDIDGPARRELPGEAGWIATEFRDGSCEVYDPEARKWQPCRDRVDADRWIRNLYGEESR